MERPRIELGSDRWFRAVGPILWVGGAFYLLLGLCMPLTMVASIAERANGAEPPAPVLVMSFVMFAVGTACAAGHFAVARGLAKRKKWAWLGATIIGAIYAPSGCLPIGVAILWAMLRTGVKESYEDEARAAAEGPTTF